MGVVVKRLGTPRSAGENFGSTWEHLGAPGSAGDKPGSADHKSGSADHKSGSADNMSGSANTSAKCILVTGSLRECLRECGV